MTAVPRPRCGNDPRAQLTPGDAQAIADFRAYLTRRAQEKTMSELPRKVFLAETAAVNEHLAEQEQQATAKAEAALAPLEAKARALQQQNDARLRAAVLREAAEVAVRAALGCGDSETGQYAASVAAGIARELRRLADEAQP